MPPDFQAPDFQPGRSERESPLQLTPAHVPRRVDLELSPELLARLQSIADASGRSLSEVATDLLSRTLFSAENPLN